MQGAGGQRIGQCGQHRDCGQGDGDAPPAQPDDPDVNQQCQQHQMAGAPLHHEQHIEGSQQCQRQPDAAPARRGGIARLNRADKSGEGHEQIMGDMQLENSRVGGAAPDEPPLGQQAQPQQIRQNQGKQHRADESVPCAAARAGILKHDDQQRNEHQPGSLAQTGEHILLVADTVGAADQIEKKQRDGQPCHRIGANGVRFTPVAYSQQTSQQNDQRQQAVQRHRYRDRKSQGDRSPAGDYLSPAIYRAIAERACHFSAKAMRNLRSEGTASRSIVPADKKRRAPSR